jgi:hypothetical protein
LTAPHIGTLAFANAAGIHGLADTGLSLDASPLKPTPTLPLSLPRRSPIHRAQAKISSKKARIAAHDRVSVAILDVLRVGFEIQG